MSLLLEALKKSEDERAQRRSGLPLHAGRLASAGSTTRSNGALWAALVMGGIAAGLAAWVFLGGKAPNQTASVAAPAAVANPSSTIATSPNIAAPAPAVTPPAETVVASPAPAPQPAAAPNRSLFIDPPLQTPSTATPAQEKAADTTNNASAAVATKPTVPSVVNKPAASAAPAKQDTPNTSPKLASVNPDSKTDTSLRIDKKISTSEVVAFAELPPEIRAELPALRLSGYMHAEQSSERLIAINDKLVRVGDEVQPGLQVMSLTASVVVMSYKGYRFRIAQ